KLSFDFCDNLADKRWEYKVIPVQHEVFSHHPGRNKEVHGAKYVKGNIVPDEYIHIIQINYPNKIRGPGHVPT
ncbi:MAG: hypothetical protein MJE68_12005, partial [Proteobacteria bacterium]|nr:hypothetical protein [Pseudomonadota bacterium]